MGGKARHQPAAESNPLKIAELLCRRDFKVKIELLPLREDQDGSRELLLTGHCTQISTAFGSRHLKLFGR
jgi:hypothetical protein